eukprot:GEMP01014157.1.p1 GENE.GEMP01014157.1~~GEMP01014157.1.p1  ORF type:complete len:566 (+),score=101.65 GEMP01014157.1:66-1763(+)
MYIPRATQLRRVASSLTRTAAFAARDVSTCPPALQYGITHQLQYGKSRVSDTNIANKEYATPSSSSINKAEHILAGAPAARCDRARKWGVGTTELRCATRCVDRVWRHNDRIGGLGRHVCLSSGSLRGASAHCQRRCFSEADPYASVSIGKKRLDSLLESEITHMSLLQPEALTLDEILAYRCPKMLAIRLQKALPVRYAVRIKLVQNLQTWDQEGLLMRVVKIYSDSFKHLRMMDVLHNNIQDGDHTSEQDSPEAGPHQTHLMRAHSTVYTTVRGPRNGSPPDTGSSAAYVIRSRRDPKGPTNSTGGTDDGRRSNASEVEDNWNFDLDPFVDILKNLKRSHCNVITLIVRGLKIVQNDQLLSSEEIDQFMNAFFTSRLGTEMITAHFLELYRDPGSGGAVELLNVREEVEEVVRDVKVACERFYGEAPAVTVRSLGDQWFPFFHHYLYYIVNEIVKNAARASVEYARKQKEPIPTITITISTFPGDDLVLKVSDQGGGVPKKLQKQIWSYLFTTAEEGVEKNIAGYGCGLPMAKTHVLYCGGDMQLYSLPNFGTDVWIRLPRKA